MKVKEEAEALKSLLNQSMNDSQAQAPVDDVPEELEPEPIFEIDYDKLKRESVRRARKSVTKIVEEVIKNPEYRNSEFVKDKIEQDAEQLGSLYYQQALIEKMQRANMESVRTGNLSPRMIEVFSQLSQRYSDMSKQMSEFQIAIKDNYAKIKFDMMEENETSFNLLGSSHANIENQKLLEKSNTFMGGKALNDEIKKERIARLSSKKTSNQKETEYIELPS